MYLIFDVSFVPLSICSIYKEVHQYQISSASPFASVHQYRSSHYRHPIPGRYLVVFRRTIIILIRFRHFSYPNFPISHLVSYENPIPDVHPTNPVYPIFPRHNDSKEPYNAPTLAMNSLLLANPNSRNRISRTKNKSETMSLPWKRLIRFIATDGRTLRGEPILPPQQQIWAL